MIHKRDGISSFQELIDALEHIEMDQLYSDIPANARAELKRMRSNLSAILAFLGSRATPESAMEPQLSEAIRTVRQECMSLHLSISKILVLQFFRLNVVMDSRYVASAADEYAQIGQTICRICQLFAPQLTEQLGGAL